MIGRPRKVHVDNFRGGFRRSVECLGRECPLDVVSSSGRGLGRECLLVVVYV